ncbi:MAG: outer membrane lipoprotein-sorting protein [Methylococcales bacterium]|nr:outer membrane lipoprotein-sorting protein [Methylococcales bacterium]
MNQLNNCLRLFIGCLLFLTHSITYGEASLTAEKVLQTIDDIRAPSDNFSFNLKVNQGTGEDGREYSFSVKVKDNEKSLVTYTAPATSKGRKILMVAENLWVYVPNTRMPIRISAQQKVSSGVSNADVARVIYNLDYSADDLKVESMDGQEVYHLFLTAKTKAAAYQRIEIWAAFDDQRPLKAKFYTSTEKQLKTIFYKNYQSILDKNRPMLLEVVDHLDGDKKILMQYSGMKLEQTPDIHFQKSYLARMK